METNSSDLGSSINDIELGTDEKIKGIEELKNEFESIGQETQKGKRGRKSGQKNKSKINVEQEQAKEFAAHLGNFYSTTLQFIIFQWGKNKREMSSVTKQLLDDNFAKVAQDFFPWFVQYSSLIALVAVSTMVLAPEFYQPKKKDATKNNDNPGNDGTGEK